MRTKLIVNPLSGRGRSCCLLPRITGTLQELGLEFDVVMTEAPGHAVELARQAVTGGYERVVAVGGDGTCHEVANGLLAAGQEAATPPVLGLIPVGSGNDFAYAAGIPTECPAACVRLKTGSARLIDAGRVWVDGTARFFVNFVGVGLDAEATVKSATVKFLRGHAVYLWSALYTIFSGHWPYDLQFSFNGQQYRQLITLLTVANGVRTGGGFLLTPQARLDDGLFDIVYATDLSKLAVLRLLPKTLKGTHLAHPAVRLARADKIEFLATQGIPSYVDGEILCLAGRRFELELLPNALRVWS